MTGKNDKERTALDRLADDLVDDILNASDQDILAEFKENHGDPDRMAAGMRALFDKTLISMNKRRLVAAKAGVTAALRTVGAVPARPVQITAARQQLRRLLNSASADQKLTLAARNEDELSDADVLGMLEAFAELGVVPPEDDAQ
jgi:hypothetical protein